MQKEEIIMSIDEFSLMIREKDKTKWYRREESAWHNHNKFSITLCTIYRSNATIGRKKKEIKQFTICWGTIVLQWSAALRADWNTNTGHHVPVCMNVFADLYDWILFAFTIHKFVNFNITNRGLSCNQSWYRFSKEKSL